MRSQNFIEDIILKDLEKGKRKSIITRFPPEPNGFLHIGHAKAICLNFGLTEKMGGKTYLRFDDTNPEKESTLFTNAIIQDVEWLGFKYDKITYTSDYFEQLYQYVIHLIKKNKAYVDDTPFQTLIKMRGNINTPGQASTYRERSVDENLILLEGMKNGDFQEGSKVLRAKIDLASSIMQFRDPILYRIKKQAHHRTKDKWVIYPTYDFAHGQSDSIEKITHSLCTLEFAPHRPLYDWFIKELDTFHSRQYEFARLNLSHTIMSKRYLANLIKEKYVDDWDDPRLPTLSGLRRRGFTPNAIKNFCNQVGVTKRENRIEFSLLESILREELNKTAIRSMVVFEPVKLIIKNYPKHQTEKLQYQNNPQDESEGHREIAFSKHIWVDREDIALQPSKKFYRLYEGNTVRLKHAYIIRCDSIILNQDGSIKEVLATYFPETKSGQNNNSTMKVKSTIHWVDAHQYIQQEVWVLENLFLNENPSANIENLEQEINPSSLRIYQAYMDSYMNEATLGKSYQFIRKGYFTLDQKAFPSKKVFLQTVSLKDKFKKKA